MFVFLVTLLSVSVLGASGIHFFGIGDMFHVNFDGDIYKQFGEEFYSIWEAPDPVSVRRLHAQRMLKLMNQSVDPCEDFYEYSCGNYSEYVEETHITNEFMFYLIRNKWLFQNLLDALVESNITTQLTEFYDTCWNAESYKVYSQFVKKFLRGYGGPNNLYWMKAEIELVSMDSGLLFKFDNNRVELASEEIQLEYPSYKSYMKFARRVLRNFGMSTAKINKMMRDVYKFQKELVSIVSDLKEEGEDVELLDVTDLEQMYPGVKFANKYLYQLTKRKDLTEFIHNTNSTTVYNFYYWKILKKIWKTIRYLNSLYDPEWKYLCAAAANHIMPLEAARVFMEEFVNAEVREDVSVMVEAIRDEVIEMFRKNKWFDQPTRMEALRKIENIVSVIGLPEELLNESESELNDGETELSKMNLFEMIFKLQRRRLDYKLKLRNETQELRGWGGQKSIDEGASYMINGVMLILSGILVHPFYHKDFAHFYKYGNLGAIVGHELMHAFDSNGMKYDGDFEKREWVTPRLKAMYVRSAECFYSLYNEKYQAEGLQTISENIPDIIGLEIAYKAYKSFAKTTENFSASELEGYEELGMDVDQLFFLSHAHTFCDVNKTLQHKGDPHAPPQIRINAALANSRDFSRAFNCFPESEMYIKRNCRYLF